MTALSQHRMAALAALGRIGRPDVDARHLVAMATVACMPVETLTLAETLQLVAEVEADLGMADRLAAILVTL